MQRLSLNAQNLLRGTLLLAVVAGGVLVAGTETAHAQVSFDPNPVIGSTGPVIQGAYFDRCTGRWVIRRDQQDLRESALDPNRNRIDPGSYQYVNRIVTDQYGVQWHESGPTWTSYGVPHGKLTRRRVGNAGPGVDIDDSKTVTYSMPNTGNQQQQQQQQQPAPQFRPKVPTFQMPGLTPQLRQQRGGNGPAGGFNPFR